MGVYSIRIPGLCAGSSINPRNDTPGYIMVVRCEKSSSTQTSSEQSNFEWYITNVLLPFIRLCCTKYYGWTPGIDISNDLTIWCWCDGANIKLNDITNEWLRGLDKSNKMCKCKHSRYRTVVEQDCGTSPIFRSIKAISKHLTTENTPFMGLELIVKNI